MNLISEKLSNFYSFDPKEIKISKQQIASVLGYNDVEVPDQVGHAIDEALSLYKDLIVPEGVFSIYPLNSEDIKKETIRLDSITFNTGIIITSHLKKSTYAAVFTATIGKSLEVLSKKLISEDDYLKGYILDSVASEAVESLCDLLQMEISNFAEKNNYHITNRYSPGYCNWPVSEQKNLFSLLPDDPCGISLTESSLMIPVKSVSGIIGIGEQVRKIEYSCSFCGLENCYKKKI